MAVSIVRRPYGVVLSDTINEATVSNSSGDALFTDTAHGLVSGDYIYIKSRISQYNGAWYVEKSTNDAFYVRRDGGLSRASYVNLTLTSTVQWQKSNYNHAYLAINTPIVYIFSNTRWPSNSVDTATTISTVVDSYGYCYLTLAAGISAANECRNLAYVQVTNGDLAGIYRVSQFVDGQNFAINVEYSAANDTALTGAGIIFYYSDYVVRVRVFAGTTAITQKPLVQICDLSLVPDSNNLVSLNVNEYIKSQIEVISNNLLLNTLPNDIDSWTQFYVSYAETWTSSVDTNGESIYTTTPSFTSDQSTYVGLAVNAKLPFKNKHAGSMSDYLVCGATDQEAKFLSTFNEVTYWPDYYFDLAFLHIGSAIQAQLKKEYYVDGVLDSTVIENFPISLTAAGFGVYRLPISESGSVYDRMDLTIGNGFTQPTLDWTTSGTGEAWDVGPPPTATPDISGSGATDRLEIPFLSEAGKTYTFTLNWTKTNSNNTTLRVFLANGSYTSVGSDTFLRSTAGTYDESGSITATGNGTKLYIDVTVASSSSNVTLNSFSVNELAYTETKVININTECSNQDIYLTWKNYLGGMDYWKFTTYKDYTVDVEATKETSKNLNADWPQSYGEFASTIDYETMRQSRNKLTIRAENLSENDVNGLRYIFSSPLVQIFVDEYNQRTVKINSNSITWLREEDNLHSLEFEISYTDLIPSQSL